MHNCVDWTTGTPRRKTPLLILSRGDDHVYTIVPNDLETLKDIAREEFDLGDVDVRFYSSCVSLCHGRPARITGSTWGLLSAYIGCATVEVSGGEMAAVQPRQGTSPLTAVGSFVQRGQDLLRNDEGTASAMTDDENDRGAKGKALLDVDEGHENDDEEHDRRDATPGETETADQWTSDHVNDPSGASAPEDDDDQYEGSGEKVESTVRLRRSRIQRRVVSESEDDIAKEERGDDRGQARLRLQSDELERRARKPFKLENSGESGNDGQPKLPRTETEYDIQTQTQIHVGSSENEKVTIRVAHRPSMQESKFVSKGTTKVAKVLAGACKSFGLDFSRATLYSIVEVEDNDGQVENLYFRCDKHDTIIRAGAGRDREAKYLLTLDGEAEIDSISPHTIDRGMFGTLKTSITR